MSNKWKQGEHIFIVGDTGQGKTYLEAKLLVYRSHVLYLQSKTDDVKFPTFSIVKSHFDIGKIPFRDGIKVTKWILRPKADSLLEQRNQFKQAYDKAWHEGSWTVVVDEAYYQTRKLRLGDDIDMLVTQGRSKNITMVVGVQRPSWISRFPISQATHVFIFQCEGRDIKTLKDAFSEKIVKPVQELTGHDFVYYNRRTKEVKVGNANKLSEIFG